MKSSLLAIGFGSRARRLLVGMACVLVSHASPALDTGAIPPYLSITGAKGNPITLADYKGKVVYLDFWASWCGPCKQSFPFMNEMQAKYGSKGFQVVGINLDPERRDADDFLVKVPAQFTIGYDPKGETPKRYQVTGMPTSLLIGADGRIIKVHAGFHEDQRKELESDIVAALTRKK